MKWHDVRTIHPDQWLLMDFLRRVGAIINLETLTIEQHQHI